MSLFKKYLEIVQEGVVSSPEFNSILKNQNDKEMDYIVVYTGNMGPGTFYVCDENGEYCDPRTTKITALGKMMEDQLGWVVEYNTDFEERYVMTGRHEKLTVEKAVKEGLDPFAGCILTIVKNKKSKK
jgi:hypothetical protein